MRARNVTVENDVRRPSSSKHSTATANTKFEVMSSLSRWKHQHGSSSTQQQHRITSQQSPAQKPDSTMSMLEPPLPRREAMFNFDAELAALLLRDDDAEVPLLVHEGIAHLPPWMAKQLPRAVSAAANSNRLATVFSSERPASSMNARSSAAVKTRPLDAVPRDRISEEQREQLPGSSSPHNAAVTEIPRAVSAPPGGGGSPLHGSSAARLATSSVSGVERGLGDGARVTLNNGAALLAAIPKSSTARGGGASSARLRQEVVLARQLRGVAEDMPAVTTTRSAEAHRGTTAGASTSATLALRSPPTARRGSDGNTTAVVESRPLPKHNITLQPEEHDCVSHESQQLQDASGLPPVRPATPPFVLALIERQTRHSTSQPSSAAAAAASLSALSALPHSRTEEKGEKQHSQLHAGTAITVPKPRRMSTASVVDRLSRSNHRKRGGLECGGDLSATVRPNVLHRGEHEAVDCEDESVIRYDPGYYNPEEVFGTVRRITSSPPPPAPVAASNESLGPSDKVLASLPSQEPAEVRDKAAAGVNLAEGRSASTPARALSASSSLPQYGRIALRTSTNTTAPFDAVRRGAGTGVVRINTELLEASRIAQELALHSHLLEERGQAVDAVAVIKERIVAGSSGQGRSRMSSSQHRAPPRTSPTAVVAASTDPLSASLANSVVALRRKSKQLGSEGDGSVPGSASQHPEQTEEHQNNEARDNIPTSSSTTTTTIPHPSRATGEGGTGLLTAPHVATLTLNLPLPPQLNPTAAHGPGRSPRSPRSGRRAASPGIAGALSTHSTAFTSSSSESRRVVEQLQEGSSSSSSRTPRRQTAQDDALTLPDLPIYRDTKIIWAPTVQGDEANSEQRLQMWMRLYRPVDEDAVEQFTREAVQHLRRTHQSRLFVPDFFAAADAAVAQWTESVSRTTAEDILGPTLLAKLRERVPEKSCCGDNEALQEQRNSANTLGCGDDSDMDSPTDGAVQDDRASVCLVVSSSAAPSRSGGENVEPKGFPEDGQEKTDHGRREPPPPPPLPEAPKDAVTSPTFACLAPSASHNDKEGENVPERPEQGQGAPAQPISTGAGLQSRTSVPTLNFARALVTAGEAAAAAAPVPPLDDGGNPSTPPTSSKGTTPATETPRPSTSGTPTYLWPEASPVTAAVGAAVAEAVPSAVPSSDVPMPKPSAAASQSSAAKKVWPILEGQAFGITVTEPSAMFVSEAEDHDGEVMWGGEESRGEATATVSSGTADGSRNGIASAALPNDAETFCSGIPQVRVTSSVSPPPAAPVCDVAASVPTNAALSNRQAENELPRRTGPTSSVRTPTLSGPATRTSVDAAPAEVAKSPRPLPEKGGGRRTSDATLARTLPTSSKSPRITPSTSPAVTPRTARRGTLGAADTTAAPLQHKQRRGSSPADAELRAMQTTSQQPSPAVSPREVSGSNSNPSSRPPSAGSSSLAPVAAVANSSKSRSTQPQKPQRRRRSSSAVTPSPVQLTITPPTASMERLDDSNVDEDNMGEDAHYRGTTVAEELDEARGTFTNPVEGVRDPSARHAAGAPEGNVRKRANRLRTKSPADGSSSRRSPRPNSAGESGERPLSSRGATKQLEGRNSQPPLGLLALDAADATRPTTPLVTPRKKQKTLSGDGGKSPRAAGDQASAQRRKKPTAAAGPRRTAKRTEEDEDALPTTAALEVEQMSDSEAEEGEDDLAPIPTEKDPVMSSIFMSSSTTSHKAPSKSLIDSVVTAPTDGSDGEGAGTTQQHPMSTLAVTEADAVSREARAKQRRALIRRLAAILHADLRLAAVVNAQRKFGASVSSRLPLNGGAAAALIAPVVSPLLAISPAATDGHLTGLLRSPLTGGVPSLSSAPGGGAAPLSPLASPKAPLTPTAAAAANSRSHGPASGSSQLELSASGIRQPPKIRIAVIVSISFYPRDPRLQRSPQCEHDSSALAALLSTIGFQVTKMSMYSDDEELRPTSRQAVLRCIDVATKSCKAGADFVSIVFVCGGGFAGSLPGSNPSNNPQPVNMRQVPASFSTELGPTPAFVVLPGDAIASQVHRDNVLALADLQQIPSNADGVGNWVVMDTFAASFLPPCPSSWNGFAMTGGRRTVGGELFALYELKHQLPLTLYLQRAFSGWATRDSRIAINSINAYVHGHLTRRRIFATTTASPYFVGDLDLAVVQELRFCRQDIKDIRAVLHGKYATLSLTVVPLRNQDPTSVEFVRQIRDAFVELLVTDASEPLMRCLHRTYDDKLVVTMRGINPVKFFEDEALVFAHCQRALRDLRQAIDDHSVHYHPMCFGHVLMAEVVISNAFARDAFFLSFENSKRIREVIQLRRQWQKRVDEMREKRRQQLLGQAEYLRQVEAEQQQAQRAAAAAADPLQTPTDDGGAGPASEGAGGSDNASRTSVGSSGGGDVASRRRATNPTTTEATSPFVSSTASKDGSAPPSTTALRTTAPLPPVQRTTLPPDSAWSPSSSSASDLPRVIMTSGNMMNLSAAIQTAAMDQAKPDVSRAAGYYRNPIDRQFLIDGKTVHDLGHVCTITFLTTEYLAMKVERAIRSHGLLSQDYHVRLTAVEPMDADHVQLHVLIATIQARWRGRKTRRKLSVLFPLLREEVAVRLKIAKDEREFLLKLNAALVWSAQRVIADMERSSRSDVRELEAQQMRYLYMDRVTLYQRVAYQWFQSVVKQLELEEHIFRAEIISRKNILWPAMLHLLFTRKVIRVIRDEDKNRRKNVDEAENKLRNLGSQILKVERRKW